MTKKFIPDPEEKELLERLYAEHGSIRKVGNTLGWSFQKVKNRLRLYGIKINPPGGANNVKNKPVLYAERLCHCGNKIRLETEFPYTPERPHEPYRCDKCRRKLDGIPYVDRTVSRTDGDYLYCLDYFG